MCLLLRRVVTSLHCSVLVASAALAGHRPVQRGVHVGRGVGAGVARRDRLRHEVLLLPTGLAIHLRGADGKSSVVGAVQSVLRHRVTSLSSWCVHMEKRT